jgi:two-component system, cell cycle sensor histidine kinase PleC
MLVNAGISGEGGVTDEQRANGLLMRNQVTMADSTIIKPNTGASDLGRLLRESLDVLGHGVALFDGEHGLRWWNATLTHILPAVATLLRVGMALEELLALVPCTISPPTDVRRAGLRALPDGRTVDVQLRALHENGTVLEVSDVTDVQRRLQSGAMLSLALQSVPAALVVLDSEDRLVMWNRAFKDVNRNCDLVVGIELEAFLRQHQDLGSLWTNPSKLDDLVAGRLALHRRYAGPFEEWFGDDRWFLTTEHPIDGGGVIIMHTDISAQKRAEQAILRAKRLADDASAAKSAFLANVSHELRTPLNAILGFAELILSEPMGPLGHDRYREYLDDIHGSGQQLLDLINTILDATKVDAGAFELNAVALEPAREALGVCKQLDIMAARQRVSLIVCMPDPVLVLEADNRAMRQMLSNLLSNAIKFSRPGGKIEIVMGHDPEGEGPWIAVCDQGIGIRSEDLPRVLLPFGQVSEAQGGAPTVGTGLGLPLVKALIELHGGRLELESTVGVGTTARLRFPKFRLV